MPKLGIYYFNDDNEKRLDSKIIKKWHELEQFGNYMVLCSKYNSSFLSGMIDATELNSKLIVADGGEVICMEFGGERKYKIISENKNYEQAITWIVEEMKERGITLQPEIIH